MHMADALLSPAVGAAGWACTAGVLAYSSRRIKDSLDEKKVPLMGVLGAFVFAAQMINFTIPATGSSGHIAGSLLLAILLGPYAAFITIASVITVQALFFADGGILALGWNIINMGFFSCFIVYPLVYKKIAGENPARGRIITGAVLGSVIGLQLGAFAVVLETLFSGISELPFGTFVVLMQPIHLAIGFVEGLITAAVVVFVWNARPEILSAAAHARAIGGVNIKRVLAGLLVAACLTAGILSWFASSNPDGLEWSMFKTAGQEEIAAPADGVHDALGAVQEKTSFLPDYAFKGTEGSNVGTSVSGVVGGAITLLIAFGTGAVLRRKKVNA